MKNLDLINFKAISQALTGSDRKIRKGSVARKYEPAIKELDDLLEYWLNRNT